MTNLAVVYGKAIMAVQGVSIGVTEGTITTILGINGAGKSTVLRAIAGFLPSENVEICDGDIDLQTAKR